MSAYIIADAQVADPAEYEDYRRQTPASIAQYGDRFIVRGGQNNGGPAPSTRR